MISYKIQNKISRASLDSIRVGGYYGDSIDTYLSGRVTSDYAQSVAYKEAEGWKLVLPCCNTNAKEGYFPIIDSYLEGGYEARISNFKAGVAEKIIEIGLEILSELKK